VTETGPFNPGPLGGRGIRLCVAAQEVDVYVYPTERERAAVGATIDTQDPSNVGAAIIEWGGNPRFWQHDRILVLYLGSVTEVETVITSVLGQPFARGRGRGPGPAALSC
jgi:hypothetical protein